MVEHRHHHERDVHRSRASALLHVGRLHYASEIRDLAADVIAAQQREIAVMEKHAAGDHDGH